MIDVIALVIYNRIMVKERNFTMELSTIKGIECYGKPALGMNYECVYENEYKDYIDTDIEATSWTSVLKQIDTSGLIQIMAV